MLSCMKYIEIYQISRGWENQKNSKNSVTQYCVLSYKNYFNKNFKKLLWDIFFDFAWILSNHSISIFH